MMKDFGAALESSETLTTVTLKSKHGRFLSVSVGSCLAVQAGSFGHCDWMSVRN